MTGICMSAFFEELSKVAGEVRAPDSPWVSKTIGAPRAKLTNTQFPKAPTAPGPLNLKLVQPAAKFGPRPNYSQPNVETPSGANPDIGGMARQQPPPLV